MSEGRSKIVMNNVEIDLDTSSHVLFGQPEEGSECETTVRIPFALWEALGSPGIITVTIDTGDLLNIEIEKTNPVQSYYGEQVDGQTIFGGEPEAKKATPCDYGVHVLCCSAECDCDHDDHLGDSTSESQPASSKAGPPWIGGDHDTTRPGYNDGGPSLKEYLESKGEI